MFSGNAAVEFIPPMIIYRSKHCYENRSIGGYNNTVYVCMANVWFDLCTFLVSQQVFLYWLFKKFIPSIINHNGKEVVLISSNVAFHFSPEVTSCLQNNIVFICLPSKTAHLCQPLGAAGFGFAKTEWKVILDIWSYELRRNIDLPKDAFSSMLHKLMQVLNQQI